MITLRTALTNDEFFADMPPGVPLPWSVNRGRRRSGAWSRRGVRLVNSPVSSSAGLRPGQPPVVRRGHALLGGGELVFQVWASRA